MSSLSALTRIFISIAVICPSLLTAQTSAAPTVTTINLNNTVLQSPVKRLGMNLGAANFYDSGQMMKNLIVSNPGFEGLIAQTMVLCSAGTATSCTDSISYSGWPADYWDGATYTVVYGTAAGRSGTITTSTSGNGQTAVFNFGDSGVAPSQGDYMIVKKPMPGNAVDGWGYTLGGGATVSTNTTDLPPDTVGTQSLVMTAPAGGSATLTYYFDSTSDHTFLQLNGSYNLSFKAKTTIVGGSTMYVSLQRLSNQVASPYVYQTAIPLTNQWQTFNFPFTASETGTAVGSVGLIIGTAVAGNTLTANQVYLDDTSLVQTNTDPTNTSAFRDPVVNTLKVLNPGVVRFWFNQLGETLDNLLAPQLGRQRSQYQYVDVNYISYGLGEFLQLLQTVGSGSKASSTPPEPWIVLPITLSDAEASNVIDYLAGPTTTKYGAIRAAAGQTAPWTTVFPKIHLEFSNEAWNNGLYGGNMANQQAYGTRAQKVFSIMRQNANYQTASFDLMINGYAYDPYAEGVIQSYCDNNDSLAAQPYMMLTVNDPLNGASGTLQSNAAAIENLFGSTFAEAEAFVTPSGTAEGISSGLVLQSIAAAQSSKRAVQFAVTETNIDPFNGGTITQAEANSYTTSIGGGLALIDSMLQNMRVGVLTQNVYSLAGYQYFPYNHPSLYLYGTVVDMGVTNLRRPQFLAEEVANNAIGSNTNMLQTVHTGLDPTWSQPSVNSVQLDKAHYLQSFGFSSGNNYSLIIINTNRSASEQVNFGGANVPGGTVQMTQLTSANITDTNETGSVVAPVTSTLANFNAATGLTLPPFSMTTLSWSATGISNVTVTNVTGTSATISWSISDASAVSVVNYGTTTAYGSQSATTPAGSTQSVTLTGLTAGTTYNFAVTSTNGAGATSSSGNFTFGTTASFTLSAPASFSLAQGQSGSVPILVADTGGYTGSVTLSIAGLPSGVTGTFTSASGGATLALSVSSTALGGTYPLAITGTAGGSSVTAPLSLNISGATQSQTITFTPIPNQYVGATVTAVATSSVPSLSSSITFSVVPNGNCSVSGSTVTFLNPGNCGIIASQAGNAMYQPASVGQIVVINSALPPQTITFNPIGDQTVGSTVSLTATSSAGLPVSFSSSTTNTCTVSSSASGSTASFIAIGTCTIVASQPGNSSYAAAISVPNSFNIKGQAQSITFPTIATQTAGNSVTLAASSTSGLAVSFSTSTGSVCSISSTTGVTTLSFTNAGSCIVTAAQAGNSAYVAAAPVSQSIVVNAAPVAQTITFGTIAAQNVGTPLTLTATSTNSTLPITYSASPSTVCSVSGSTASFAATGTCTITASQAGNSSYLAATPVSQSFTVNAALKSQTITFVAISDQYVGTPLTLTANSSSGLTVSFASSTAGVCTVSTSAGTSSAQFIGAGTCTIVASQAGDSTYAAATPVSQNINVNATAYPQTITFNPIATQTVGTPLTLTATASSKLAVTYTATPGTVCSVMGSTATFLGAGTCTITASQAGNSGYAAATPVSQSFTVSAQAQAQTITFNPIPAQTVGSTLTVSATASSGLPVTFTVVPNGNCSVSGNVVTFLNVGNCGVVANQAGNSSYTAAPAVGQIIVVNQPTPQTISFGGISAQTVGTPLTLTASASSGLAVSYASSTSGVCTVSGSTVTFVAAGTCSITATQPGNNTYSAATPVTQSFTVSTPALKSQTITFGSIGAQTVGTPLTLTATVNSSLPITYTSSTTGVCMVSGNTASFLAAGTCTITASQAGNTSYSAATPVSQSFAVNGQAQTITFNAIAAQTVGSTLTVSATASSGLPVTFTVVPNGNCSVSGNVVTFLNVGNCGVVANQAGNSAYAAAPAVGQIIVVNQATPQTISFGGIAAQTVGTPLMLTASASSGLAVSYASNTTGVCTVSGSTVTFVTAGTCSITASQAGNSTYSAATPVTQSFTVASSSTLKSQTITFGSIAAQTVGTPLALTASASSNLAVTYVSSTTSVCMVSGNTASFVAAGTCTITASQAGNSTYSAATPVSQSFAVNAQAQTITFNSIPAQTVGSTLTVSATASSGLPVSFTVVPNGNCSVSGNVVTFLNVGNCGVVANQAGNSAYAAAPAVGQIIVVNQPTPQTISFGGIAAQTVGTPLTLMASASSGLPVSYASSTSGVCTVSGSTVTFVAAGTCSITASQAGNSTYSAATPVTQSFTVTSSAASKSQTITFGSIGAQTAGTQLTLTASASSNLAVTYVSSTTGVCSVSGSTASLLAAGTCTITASQAGNSTYSAATPVSQSFTVNAQAQTITFNSIPAQTVGSTLTVNATASSGLPVTFTVVPNGNCSVSGNVVTFVNYGNCGVVANQAGNSTYAAAPAVGQIIVVNLPTPQTISFGAIATQTVGTPLTLMATSNSGLPVSYASSTTGVCTVAGSTVTFVAAGTCTITASQPGNSTYSAAPSVTQSFTVQSTLTAVNLNTVANVYGIFANGSSVSNGGLDAYSYAYSSNLLGSSLTVGGIPFNFGTAGTADAVANATVSLPAGSYSTLYFLGTGVDGNQVGQKFTVTYTDGTTTVATQSLSDWGSPQSYSGEGTGSTMAYRVTPSGGTQSQNWYLYKYSIALNSAKTVQSITLPSNRLVVVLAMTLAH